MAGFDCMIATLRRFMACESGATAIEYGLIASCVALAFIAIAILLTGHPVPQIAAIALRWCSALARSPRSRCHIP